MRNSFLLHYGHCVEIRQGRNIIHKNYDPMVQCFNRFPKLQSVVAEAFPNASCAHDTQKHPDGESEDHM